ncbi:SURF1 family protein [Rhodobacter sp. NTK016B]|uniref:SURF1 family protein n=1 Tax=Rhodobacter sp. NTK016B TaxID=2759676 RepID=UPI001A8FC264|nr:SURF1 family protein [Rhodobacter sp. NTK016B]
MNGRLIGAGIFGIAGVAILLWLGFWQLNRLEWKLDLIERIETRIHNDPVLVPADATPDDDRYLPVIVQGRYTGEYANVLSSQREAGPGVRIIAVLETETGRRLLVDRGFVRESQRDAYVAQADGVTVIGNLDWPGDRDSFTPDPDEGRNLYFARDPLPIAEALDAEPLLIVAREDSAAAPPLMTDPISGAALKNDHLEYALTWFMLATVWAVMTIALLWRIRRTSV